MARYEVTSDRLPVKRGEVVELDPDAVNIAALLAAGHVKPDAEQVYVKARPGKKD